MVGSVKVGAGDTAVIAAMPRIVPMPPRQGQLNGIKAAIAHGYAMKVVGGGTVVAGDGRRSTRRPALALQTSTPIARAMPALAVVRWAHPVSTKKHGTSPARSAPNLVRVVAENCRSA
jgi:hypothetical protein